MLASIGVWTRRNRGGGFSLPSSFHRGQVRFSSLCRPVWLRNDRPDLRRHCANAELPSFYEPTQQDKTRRQQHILGCQAINQTQACSFKLKTSCHGWQDLLWTLNFDNPLLSRGFAGAFLARALLACTPSAGWATECT